MAVKEKQDSAKDKSDSLRNRRIWMGAAAITIIVLALFFLFNRQNTPTVIQEPEIGVMDMAQVMRAHKDYGQLQTLLREAASMEAELKLKSFELNAQAVTADKKLFEDAAKQKANLEIITSHSERMDELKAQADAIYDRMKQQFDQERSAIDREYENRILNIQIKADNATTLELTEAERASLQAEWNRLKDERNERHNQLLKDQQRRYEAAVEAATGEARRSMMAEENRIRGQAQTDEMQHFAEVQGRNAQTIDEAMKPIQLKMDLARKKTALELKLKEIDLLEEKIFEDISSRAAKLAMIHHLNLIIADPVDNILGLEYSRFGFGTWHELRSPVIGINTLDLTEEMLQEVKNIQ